MILNRGVLIFIFFHQIIILFNTRCNSGLLDRQTGLFLLIKRVLYKAKTHNIADARDADLEASMNNGYALRVQEFDCSEIFVVLLKYAQRNLARFYKKRNRSHFSRRF